MVRYVRVLPIVLCNHFHTIFLSFNSSGSFVIQINYCETSITPKESVIKVCLPFESHQKIRNEPREMNELH